MAEIKDGTPHTPHTAGAREDALEPKDPHQGPALEPQSEPVETPATPDAVSATPVPAAAVPSAFGVDAKEADALWASLGSAGAAGSAEPAAKAEEGTRPAHAEVHADAADADAATPLGDEAEHEAGKAGVATPAPARTGKGPFGGKALGPVMQAIPLTADGESLVPTPPTVFSRIFAGLSFVPLVLPLLLLAAQVVFTLDGRALWYSDEVRYADAYRNMVESGNWLVLSLNGGIYPDKPPLFFWFLYALEKGAATAVPGGLPMPLLFYAGMALSGLLCLVATHALAVFVARVDRRTVLAADLVLVSGFFFSGLLHYLRMDLMFAALITLSHVLLFHAWVRERARVLLVGGFLLAGLAVLVKGPLGLAFPLLAGVCFLLWQGRVGRLFRLDVLIGLLVGLAVPLAWLAMAWLDSGDAFVTNILHKQVIARALDTWHHAEPWYHYLMTFPLIWLPWTLLLFFLPWGRLFGKGMREGLKLSRTLDGAGLAYLWCAFLPGVILLSAVSIKLPIYCLPLFPPLAILCARAMLRMRPVAAAGLQYALVLLLALLGIGLMLSPLVPEELLHIPQLPQGTAILGGVCLVFACALAFLAKPRRSEGMLLLMALFTTAFAYPVWSIAAPSLDVFLSPKAQAEVVLEYRKDGYVPVAFKIYPGTYSYYAGTVPDFPTWEETLAAVKAQPKALMALRASFWDKLADKPEGFKEVHRQTIAEREYVLVARPPRGGETPPAEQAAPAAIPAPAPVTTQTPAPEASGTPPAPAAQPEVSAPAPAPAPVQAPAPTPAPAPASEIPAPPPVPAQPEAPAPSEDVIPPVPAA